ncbi:branched-subunit amino acid ABC-type transport system permease component [Catenulispora sp. GP43]|uniref:branched-chain amino acid ABC transporter permease n=1 Tax=Catenulispora sp. GP43 TaxID=3156263 RepID=UPI003511C6CF
MPLLAESASLSLTIDLAIAGLAVGSAAALSGIGLVVTYRATGVLNLAQGAQAMIIAYLLRELVVVWHWPVWPAAVVCLLVVAPALGVVLELGIFRPLQRRGAGPAETMVATIGVFILLTGAVVLIWGTGPYADAPSLVPSTPFTLPGGHAVRLDTAVQLGVVLALSVLVAVVTRFTRFGLRLRAVVDDRALAGLSGVNAGRVSAIGWAFGSVVAGLVGVLLAPNLLLDPYGLSLLVMETMAVAVAGRLRSVGVAVAVGLGLGVIGSELTRLRPGGQVLPLVQAVQSNLFVIALLVVALLPGRLGSGAQAPPARAAAVGRGAPERAAVATMACTVLLLMPLGFRGGDLRNALQVPALALVLLSVVVVTGYGGQVSLGQAGYAGMGALGTGLFISGKVPGVPAMPAIPALLCAVLVTIPLGLLTGWPAIRRRGLALALVTFAVGTAMSRFVFDQPYATTGLTLDRPGFLADDRAFYAAELALLALGVVIVRNLHRRRLGRALTALRDHEAGASAAGLNVPWLKVFAFLTGAGLAALGGGLMGLGGRAFNAATFDPLQGLLWFAAVVVAGADSALGAVLAAALLVGLDAGTTAGLSTVVVGALAVAIGRLPGGLAGWVAGLGAAASGASGASGVSGGSGMSGAPGMHGASPASSLPPPRVRLSPLGVRVHARLRARIIRREAPGQVRP